MDVLHALLHSIRNHIFLKKRLKKQKWGRMVRLDWLKCTGSLHASACQFNSKDLRQP